MDEARLMVENGYKKVDDPDYKEWWAKDDENGEYSFIKLYHHGHIEVFGSIKEAEIMLRYAKWLKDFDECL